VTHQQFMPSDVHYAQAHNDYLQILAEGGWVFAIPAVACIAVAAIEIRRRFREGRDGPENYWLRVGAVAGLLAISVQEIAEFSLQMPAIFALFCVNAAVAVRPRPQPSEPRA
jgi:O-antigen ligase